MARGAPKRLVVDPASLEGERVVLRDKHYHYACRVMRLQRGQSVLLADGAGREIRGQIEEVLADEAWVRLEGKLQETAEPQPRLSLIYGLARGSRTEVVLQKATELGVGTIYLAVCERSVARPPSSARAAGKQRRWEEILTQATRQCGRPQSPHLDYGLPFAAALAACETAEARLVAHPTEEAMPLERLRPTLQRANMEVAIAIGPEGGFSAAEVRCAQAAGFVPVSLGRWILRTETAAITALAILNHLLGRI